LNFMSSIKPLRVRRRDETKHFLAVGDTGVGKSQFIKQILYYAEECGDSCVVLDPERRSNGLSSFRRTRPHGDRSPENLRGVFRDGMRAVNDSADLSLSQVQRIGQSARNDLHTFLPANFLLSVVTAAGNR
jgi:hypothetical protein